MTFLGTSDVCSGLYTTHSANLLDVQRFNVHRSDDLHVCLCMCGPSNRSVCANWWGKKALDRPFTRFNGSGLAEADTGRKAQAMKPPADLPNFQNSHSQHSQFICWATAIRSQQTHWTNHWDVCIYIYIDFTSVGQPFLTHGDTICHEWLTAYL